MEYKTSGFKNDKTTHLSTGAISNVFFRIKFRFPNDTHQIGRLLIDQVEPYPSPTSDAKINPQHCQHINHKCLVPARKHWAIFTPLGDKPPNYVVKI